MFNYEKYFKLFSNSTTSNLQNGKKNKDYFILFYYNNGKNK